MEIYNVGNNSVNLYLLKSSTHNLLVDTGFPGTLNDLGRELRKTHVKIKDIDFLIVTHFHPDHSGLIQDLKDESVKFVILDFQIPFINKMEQEKQRLLTGRHYKTLVQTDNICIQLNQSRDFLKTLSINGEIISTRGHSDDGISLILDSGEAFVGDLMQEDLAFAQHDLRSITDWKNLRRSGAKRIFPGHIHVYDIRNDED